MPDSTPIPVHRQATRRVALQFDEHGNPMFATVCSPESFPARALAVAPKRHVIPVIFVPGIMGSNLRTKYEFDEKRAPAWRPPNSKWQGIKEWWWRSDQKPKERQEQLTPWRCEVDPGGEISLTSSTYSLTTAEARRRGWGEINWGSYGSVLLELERVLNDQYEDCGQRDAKVMATWKHAMTLRRPQEGKGDLDLAKVWGVVKGECTPLTEDEFKRLDDYYYPVWACGYNWLESNEESAKRLVARIDEALAWYGRPECHFIPEGRVLIVTHSMGGLVGRRAAQLAEDRILGVVHGVQPVGGAPVVYRRFRAGTESGGWWDMVGNMTATVMGADAADITCVMANAPGPLELLPTKHYPSGWLRFEYEADGKTEELMEALPKADPYAEIYAKRVQDVWWGMVDETLIDPAGLAKEADTTPIKMYREALKAAVKFHDGLKLHFHPRTYAHYGSDTDRAAFGWVRWVSSDDVPGPMREKLKTLQATEWTRKGKAKLGDRAQPVRLKLANRAVPDSAEDDNAGDETVPRPSGLLAEKGNVKTVFCMKGFDHQSSYANRDVLDNLSWCLGKLILDAKPISEITQSKGSAWTEPSDADSSGAASQSSQEEVQ